MGWAILVFDEGWLWPDLENDGSSKKVTILYSSPEIRFSLVTSTWSEEARN
jgi:hypothetical protein